MKGLHISDVHNDRVALNAVKDHAIRRNDLEFIAITGDFLGPYLSIYEGGKIKNSFEFIVEHIAPYLNPDEPVSFNEVLEQILKSSSFPIDFKQAAEEYVSLINKFEANAENQYSDLINILEQFPQNVLTIPGNWDSPSYFKFFEAYDIHRKNTRINGVKFAGYGGANMGPSRVPNVAVMNFDEKKLDKFLSKEDPDVALTHMPAEGIQDMADEETSFGCCRVLTYARGREPSAVLSGHAHSDIGIGKDDFIKTVFVNAGNLGFYEESLGKGYFYEIDVDNKGVYSTIPCKVVSGQVIINEEADILENEILTKKTRVEEKPEVVGEKVESC